MNGFVLIDKPEGPTSAEVVRRVKRKLRAKVGHLGTLDPFATGLLPLCVGKATRAAAFLSDADKEYEGLIRLGVRTDTADPTGSIVEECPVPSLAPEDLAALAARFTGEIEQVPPMYSAMKRQGVPLYRLARQGKSVERKPRRIRIYHLTLAAAGPNAWRFHVRCSKGTYVRVLAEDLARAAGTVAHLATLRRTQFGPFRVVDAQPLEGWEPETTRWISIEEALREFTSVPVDTHTEQAILHGRQWVLDQLALPAASDRVLLLNAQGGALAVVARKGKRWALERVLA